MDRGESDSQGSDDGKKKARLQGNLPDRLSDLPECLIVQILSLLDMRDAVKTSVLSKRWKLLWTNVDSIVYDYCHCAPVNKSIQHYISFIDSTLMRSTCLNIKRFSLLDFGIGFNFKNDNLVHKLVDKWISFVLKMNVEELILDFHDLDCDYPAPDCLYCSSSLVQFYSKAVQYLRPPLWTSLKSLSLVCMLLKDETIANILLGCPVLEELLLDEIHGLNRLNIMSPSVKRVELSNIDYQDNGEEDFLKITAPWIEELKFTCLFMVPQCQLVDVSSVRNVTMNFYWGTGTNDYDALLAGYDYNLWWINMVMDFLQILCKVDTLTIGSEIVQNHEIMYYTSAVFDGKYMHHCLPEGKLMHLKNLKVDYSSIWFSNRHYELDYTLVEYVLKNSCILEELVVLSPGGRCNHCLPNCAAKYAHQLASRLFEIFLATNENIVWELKKSKSRLEFRFSNYAPLVPQE